MKSVKIWRHPCANSVSILSDFCVCSFPDVILDRLKTKQEAELEEVKRRAAEEAQKARQEADSGSGEPGGIDAMIPDNGSCSKQESSDGNTTNEQTSANGESRRNLLEHL